MPKMRLLILIAAHTVGAAPFLRPSPAPPCTVVLGAASTGAGNLALSPSGAFLATVGGIGAQPVPTVQVFDARKGALGSTASPRFSFISLCHDNDYSTQAITWSPAENAVALTCRNSMALSFYCFNTTTNVTSFQGVQYSNEPDVLSWTAAVDNNSQIITISESYADSPNDGFFFDVEQHVGTISPFSFGPASVSFRVDVPSGQFPPYWLPAPDVNPAVGVSGAMAASYSRSYLSAGATSTVYASSMPPAQWRTATDLMLLPLASQDLDGDYALTAPAAAGFPWVFLRNVLDLSGSGAVFGGSREYLNWRPEPVANIKLFGSAAVGIAHPVPHPSGKWIASVGDGGAAGQCGGQGFLYFVGGASADPAKWNGTFSMCLPPALVNASAPGLVINPRSLAFSASGRWLAFTVQTSDLSDSASGARSAAGGSGQIGSAVVLVGGSTYVGSWANGHARWILLERAPGQVASAAQWGPRLPASAGKAGFWDELLVYDLETATAYAVSNNSAKCGLLS